ncbi:MAG: AAA family ATPase [Planctomycetes bacterium]|jgi:predicted ATPase|nr:AAA family ATPase [Planctomycetota bacterium]
MKSVVKRVIVKRFRSFPSDAVEFNNPVFLVGRNGAGKSNFVDLFSFVAEAMLSPLQAVFDRRGGISTVRNRSSGRSYPPNLGLAFELGEMNEGTSGGRFAFEIRALPGYGFEVIREQCLVRYAGGDRWWFDRQKEFRTNAEGLKPSVEASALSLPVIGGDERFAPLLRALSAMRVYSIEPAKLREMQDPDGGAVLRRDGGNAASVLQEIARSDPETKARVQEILESIVPNTVSVKPKKHGNKLSLEFTQEWASGKKLLFEAFNMSDGTLRALGLLMAVFQSPRPSVLVLEEPEATIHPGALGAVLDLIRHASRSMQVIVTTHSPEVLDAQWIEDQHLRIVVWQEGASHVACPNEASRLAMTEHLMGAGELLRSNAMQPAPLFTDPHELQAGSLFEVLG